MFSWVPLCFLPYNLSISGEEGRTWDEGHVRVCCKAEPWAELSRWYSQDCHCFSPDAQSLQATSLNGVHSETSPADSISMTRSLQPGCICTRFPRTCYFLHTHTSLTLRFPLYLIFLRPTFSKVNVFTLHTMLGLPYLFKVRVGLKIDHQGPWESSCSRAEKASERHALDHLKNVRKCLKMCTVLKYIYIYAFSRHFYPMCLKNTHSAFCQSQIVYYARFI